MPSPLPDELEEYLIEILMGPTESQDGEIASLCDSNAVHADSIRGFVEGWRDEDPDDGPSSGHVGPDSILRGLEEREVGSAIQLPGETSQLPEDEHSSKYRVLDELGRGGVGVVFRGEDRDLGRSVALKFLRTAYHEQPAIVRRFVEEAQIGAQLQHPGILPVYDLGIADGKPFFAMKLVSGDTLRQRLRDRVAPTDDLQRMLRIFEQVCQAVGYAHARGVVHRDLKPDNVMIGKFGEVQVVDWGMGKVLADGTVDPEPEDAELRALALEVEKEISTVRSHDGAARSLPATVLGTPAYMAPEQALGDVVRTDRRSDVFALGSMLCEILTGRPVYHGKDVLAKAETCATDDALTRLRAAAVDRQLVELAVECLSADPAARPADAAVLGERIGGYLAAVEDRARAAQQRVAAARQRQRWMAVVIVAVLAGLAVSVCYWSRASDLATDKTQLAAEKEKERAKAQAHLDNFNDLRNVVLLRRAREAEARLHPGWPSQLVAIRAWQREHARPLLAAQESLAASLREVAARGSRPPEKGPSEKAPLSFARAEDAFLHEALTELLADVRKFTATTVPAVAKRESWAAVVAQLSIVRYAERWRAARAALQKADGVVAHAAYRSDPPLDLAPQVGLVPIGMNPRTKLWEFYHLASAADPAAAPPGFDAATGRIEMTDATGMVFVLVPGGAFDMGAQRAGTTRANYDAHAHDDEGPVHEVRLEPFFMARHEMTRGQWRRICAGDAPVPYYVVGEDYRGIGVVRESHPVENLSWQQADRALRRNGLQLPTEAQWEYACRAGTSTPWSSGPVSSALSGFANVLDLSVLEHYPEWGSTQDGDFEDGYVGPAPVGVYVANDWGFHDMMGNLSELCRDRYADYRQRPKPGDGLRSSKEDYRVIRGGNSVLPANNARVSARAKTDEHGVSHTSSVRACRAVRPAVVDPSRELGLLTELFLVDRLDAARRSSHTTYPAWPERIPAIEGWIDEHGGSVREARAQLRSVRERLVAGDSAAAIQRFVTTGIDALIGRCDAFLAADLAKARGRLHWARGVAARTVAHPGWAAARRAIASADDRVASRLYRAEPPLQLVPQPGLVPLGMNPETKLWEFYHPASAADPAAPPPKVGAPVTDAMGMVFVLVPGGRFTMGAQSKDADAPGFDRHALALETPVHVVELTPFFLARHEMTKGQWQRLSGGEVRGNFDLGSVYKGVGKVTPSHPVETVSWLECNELLGRHGLQLPTEAQWEYACRAGTTTPRFFGTELDGLDAYANVYDKTARRIYPAWRAELMGDLSDGVSGISRVGRYRPNPWGFHDILGNVDELCRDRLAPYTTTPRQGDGLRDGEAFRNVVRRGGSYHRSARYATASRRQEIVRTFQDAGIGLRAARRLTVGPK